MKFTVITKVPDPKQGTGNLALDLNVWFETEERSEKNGWEGGVSNATTVLGPMVMRLRTPVFRVGEILVIDSNDRDLWDRKPSKWAVETEQFDTFEEAYARAKAAVDPTLTL